MHNKKKEEQREAAPKQRNTAEEKLFRSNSGEKGRAAEDLAQDQQFRKFFTTSVIEVPEEMRKVDRDLTDIDEPEEKKPRRGGWFRNVFKPSEDDGEANVRIPKQALGQAKETEENFEETFELIDEEEEPQPKKPAPHKESWKKEEPAAKQTFMKKETTAEQTAAPKKEEPAHQPAHQETFLKKKQQAVNFYSLNNAEPTSHPASLKNKTPIEKKPATAQTDSAKKEIQTENKASIEHPSALNNETSAEKEASAGHSDSAKKENPTEHAASSKNETPREKNTPAAKPEHKPHTHPMAKTGAVDVGSLLEQIDEVQANVTGHEAAQKLADMPKPHTAKNAGSKELHAETETDNAEKQHAEAKLGTAEKSYTEAKPSDSDAKKPEAGKKACEADKPAPQEKAGTAPAAVEKQPKAASTQESIQEPAAPAEKPEDAADAKTVMMLEPTTQELADRVPEKKTAGKPLAENNAAEKAPTGRIVFADEEPEEPQEQAPADHKKAKASHAEVQTTQPAEVQAGQEENPQQTILEDDAGKAPAEVEDTRIYHAPKEDAAPDKPAEEPLQTGEVSLAGAEATGEIALAPAEPTGELPLTGEETEELSDEEEPEEDEPHGRLHGWKKFTHLFSGEEEPEAPAEENNTIPFSAAAGGAPNTDDTGELEYCSTEDADAIRNELEARTGTLTLRCTLSGILAVALTVLDLMGQGVVPSPAILDPVAAPAAWLGVHLILLGVCIALALPVMKNGLLSLLPHKAASADSLAAVAAVAAVLQTTVGLLKSNEFDSAQITMFSGAAALLLFVTLLGQRLALDAVRDGFAVMTSGVNNATGYCLADARLLHTLCEGMDEKDPVLLLSRPGSLLKNFMAQSFAPHRADRLAVEFARALGLASIVGLVITLAKGRGVTAGFSVMAALLCMGAPLSAALIRAIPSRLMQRAAAQVGAVIPGWPAIEQLGEVDMVQADASELFPPMCAHLYGIKTFQKERIDLAILYATSILIESCNTLSGLFRNMIENHTDMLYPVKDLEKRTGSGYLAWCDNCRVLLGTRELMSQEGIALPAMDYENRYTQNGDRHVLYLAVSGELYAMFLYGYTGTKKVAHTLSILRRENIRLLVTADDPTLTEERIEEAYRLRPGFVKVLNGTETAAMAPATAYLPATDGCLVHLGGFASLIGGLQAAAGADSAEHNACTIQIVSVTVSILLGLLLSFAGSLAHISLAAVLLYQIAWSALGVAITITKKY
jgi:hypothetical protein